MASGLAKYQKAHGIDPEKRRKEFAGGSSKGNYGRPDRPFKKNANGEVEVKDKYTPKPKKVYDSPRPMSEGKVVDGSSQERKPFQRKPFNNNKPVPVMSKNPNAKGDRQQRPKPLNNKPATGFRAPKGMKPTATPEQIIRKKAKAPAKLMYRKQFNSFREVLDTVMGMIDVIPFMEGIWDGITPEGKSDWELGQEMLYAIAAHANAATLTKLFTTKGEINSYVYFKNNKVEYLMNSKGGGIAFFWNYKKLEDGTVVRNDEDGHPVEIDIMISSKETLAVAEPRLKELGFKLHEDTKVSRATSKRPVNKNKGTATGNGKKPFNKVAGKGGNRNECKK